MNAGRTKNLEVINSMNAIRRRYEMKEGPANIREKYTENKRIRWSTDPKDRLKDQAIRRRRKRRRLLWAWSG